MRILIANDDGYLAPGLAALVEAVRGLGEIDVIAPERNASGTSNALTLDRPLQVFSAKEGVQAGYRFVNGTPSDCVHVALTGLMAHRPDLVLSGINQGANMGDDTLYSGTVAAAMEGHLFGMPAIAFSQTEKGWAHLDAAARTARAIVEHVLEGGLGGAYARFREFEVGPLARRIDARQRLAGGHMVADCDIDFGELSRQPKRQIASRPGLNLPGKRCRLRLLLRSDGDSAN